MKKYEAEVLPIFIKKLVCVINLGRYVLNEGSGTREYPLNPDILSRVHFSARTTLSTKCRKIFKRVGGAFIQHISVQVYHGRMYFFAVFFVFFFIPVFVQARITDWRSYGPLHTQIQNPLHLQFLAMPMEDPQTLEYRQFETYLHTTFSNVFEYDQSGSILINMDMEIWRTVLGLGYAITPDLDVFVEVSVISNGGGFLDGMIQGYHSLFNFPNGGRELVANNQFSHTLSQNGTTLFNHAATGFGFSDTTLRFKLNASYVLPIPFEFAMAPYIKIPTGSETKGLGSGHVDFGLSFFAHKKFLRRFHSFTQLGMVVLGSHDALGALLKPTYFNFGQSFEYQIVNGLSALIQLTGSSPAFKNRDNDDLSKMIMDFNVGVAGAFPLNHKILDEFFYQGSFGEDILSTGPSVDFSVFFLTGVRY